MIVFWPGKSSIGVYDTAYNIIRFNEEDGRPDRPRHVQQNI